MSVSTVIFLHIGIHKTGTSALQRFFYINRELLKLNGYNYPTNDISLIGIEKHAGAQHKLASALRVTRPRNIAICDFEKLLTSAINESTTVDRMLISSEVFMENIYFDVLSTLLNFFHEVRIIVYLRRQDELCTSVYNQYVKSGTPHEFSIKSLRDLMPGMVNYIEKLENWVDLFGKENIIVRSYERSSFYQGNIFDDFLHHVLEINSSDGYIFPEAEVNSSLSAQTLEYKRLINHLNINKNYKLQVVPILIEFDFLNRDTLSSLKSLLSAKERASIIDRFYNSNAQIAQQFLGRADGCLFRDSLIEPDHDRLKSSVLSPEQLAAISQFIARKDTELTSILSKAIKQALTSNDYNIAQAAKDLSIGFDVT